MKTFATLALSVLCLTTSAFASDAPKAAKPDAVMIAGAGTPAALSGYFKTAGNIKYTTAANNTVARTLTTTVSDGTLSASSTSTASGSHRERPSSGRHPRRPSSASSAIG